MRKPVLTIFYQYDPWNATIGGIQSFINTFIKYAPDTFDLRMVGTGGDPAQTPGEWHDAEYMGKPIQFFPLFTLVEDDTRGLVPTSVKYTGALLGQTLASDFMHFHRIEPTLATFRWPGEKTLFVHNDIQQQVSAAKNANSILWQRFPALYFTLERFLVAQFDKVISCNSNSTQFYRQRYPRFADRIDDFKYAIDPKVFAPLSPDQTQAAQATVLKRLGLPADTRLILFAGRLHPQKDPLLLVRAIAALNDPTAHLLMAGDGELKADIVAEIEKHQIQDRITLLGAVPHDQLAELHQVASAFVLSSVYEGLPLAILEALSCGTPIVTMRSGHTPNVLTVDSGIVVDERTPTALAAALGQVVDHPDAYPASACTQVAAPYQADQVIGNLFEDMLSRWQVA
ncbi:MAG: glycosyltransferase [Cyanobacteria bacterium J06554_6]